MTDFLRILTPKGGFEMADIGIVGATGGVFEPLRHLRYPENPRAFISAVLDLLREHAPALHRRVGAQTFEAFCQRIERDVCSYVVPVSDASNARLQPPTPHFRQILGAAAANQAIADVHADGYNHLDRFWAIASSAERTATFLPEHGAMREASPAPV
jgi:hypothetical protein